MMEAPDMTRSALPLSSFACTCINTTVTISVHRFFGVIQCKPLAYLGKDSFKIDLVVKIR